MQKRDTMLTACTTIAKGDEVTDSELTPDKIKALSEKLGLSRQELALRLGVDPATVARWENGTSSPTGTAAAVLKALIASTVLGIGGIGLIPMCLPAYGIYSLLAAAFKNANDPGSTDSRQAP